MSEIFISGSVPSLPLRILVADDSEKLREAVKNLLAGRADRWLVCAESSDGEDALKKIREFQPDLILLDLSIPVVSGLDVARILQRQHPSTTVVLMSAQDRDMLARIASAARVPHYVSKTALAKDLVPLLEAISHRGHTGSQAMAAAPNM